MGGYEILKAIDTKTGIELVHKYLPEFILMDIQLPGMDGLSATRIIKTDPKLQHIPVIALTSYAMKGDAEKSKEAGCSGYIAKPIDTRSFLEKIAQYFKSNHKIENSNHQTERRPRRPAEYTRETHNGRVH